MSVEWWHEDRIITFTWLGHSKSVADRVYALAFTPDRQILLVSDNAHKGIYWLPGGGVELGESPEEALERELMEEAGATVEAAAYLGTQRADDPASGSSYQAIYRCRVALAEAFTPEHEIVERRLVAPDAFLDTLLWGRSGPKALVLLEQALRHDEAHG